MRLVVSLAVFLALSLPRLAQASGFSLDGAGNYVALGPTVGTTRIGGHRAPHVGAELSAGRVDRYVGYGGWIDFQKAFGSLDTQNRVGAGLQIMTGGAGVLGVDAGVLAIHERGVWYTGFRARVFLTAGWLGVAGGGGVVEELGHFTEFSLLIKVPFSCGIDGALKLFCAEFWEEARADRAARARRREYERSHPNELEQCECGGESAPSSAAPVSAEPLLAPPPEGGTTSEPASEDAPSPDSNLR